MATEKQENNIVVMKAAKFYNSITEMTLVATCVGITIDKWDAFMDGTKKASYKEVHKLIKKLCPDMVGLTWRNPYKYQYKRKDKLIVVVHSAIEYFFEV
jgi:hypothetical protein